MTFLEGIEGLGAEGIGAQLPRSFLAPLVTRGLEEGLSGNAMLTALREAGQGIRTQTFYQLVGEVRSATAMSSTWQGLALDELPPATAIVEWEGGGANTYLYRINYFARETEEGETNLIRRGISIQSDTPITPQEALDRAAQLIDDNDELDQYKNQTSLGFTLSGIYHQLGAA